jgi:hypothetical protein
MLGGLAAAAGPLLLPDSFAAFVTAGPMAAGNIRGIGIDPSYVDGRVD